MEYEAYHFGENNMISRFHNYNFSYPRNIHRSFELAFVKDGSMQVSINNKLYKINKNEAILILPYQSHTFISNEYSDSYLCVFSHEFVSAFDKKVYGKSISNPIINLASPFNSMLLDKVFNNTSTTLELKGCLYLICSEFLNNGELIDNPKTDYELLHKVFNYVQENYTKDITLRDVAKDLNYSYTYLSKYINNFLGISFVDFINENRISYAISLLNNTDFSITDIAYKCGYTNVRSFNRNFIKIIHKTPTEYKASK